MTTLKLEYQKQATIYNKNLKAIKRQLNSTQLFDLKKLYNCSEDSQLAKITMLRGIEL
jgi:hypothetical protein